MLRPVESRILPAYSDLSTGSKQTKNRLFRPRNRGNLSADAFVKLPVELVRKPAHLGAAESRFSPVSTRLKAQIPSVATTCRKSDSFARDKGYLTLSYHRGKGIKQEFFDAAASTGF